MNREVVYMAEARQDLRRLDKKTASRIMRKLDGFSEREGEFGKLLRNLPSDIVGLRSYRIGNYRAIFRLTDEEIKVYIIEHRSKVYRKLR